ncbi:hypothetical protein QTP88_019970 [Uroleucon formosanum]
MDIRDRGLESTNVYPNYHIKLKYWDILGTQIQPKKSTLSEIKLIMELYGFPKNPSEVRWTYMDINFKGLPSTIQRQKLNCITNTKHMTKRKKLSNDEKCIYDYQGCVINVPHDVVEREAEQSSTQGDSSSKIDYDPHIVVEQEAEQSSTQGESSSKIDNVPHVVVEQEAEQSSTQGESSSKIDNVVMTFMNMMNRIHYIGASYAIGAILMGITNHIHNSLSITGIGCVLDMLHLIFHSSK